MSGNTLQIVQYLIEKGADIEAKDKHQETPYIKASKQRHNEITQYLVERGVKTDKPHNTSP